MSVNKTLWIADIPHRKYAYGGLYLGKILAIMAIFALPSYSLLTSIGVALILFSTFYLSERLYKSGFRKQSVQLTLLLLLLSGLTIAGTLFYRTAALE